MLDGIDPLSRKHGPEIYLVSLTFLTKFIRFFWRNLTCENIFRAFFTKPPAKKENAAENEKKTDESKIPAKTKTLQEHSQSSATLT